MVASFSALLRLWVGRLETEEAGGRKGQEGREPAVTLS